MREIHRGGMSQNWLRFVFIAFLASASVPAYTQSISESDIRRLTQANAHNAISLFRDFLSLPNDANYPDDIQRLIDWLEPRFRERGFVTRRIDTDRNPFLFAERIKPGATSTLLVYLQADGQPVDPSAWQQEDPYTPVLKEQTQDGVWERIPWSMLDADIDEDWRIFARSASDSKGPMTQFLTAIDILNEAGIEPGFSLKVIVDTEEEKGSPNLAAAVLKHRDLLAADMLLIFDGPPHASNAPTVAFGARGIARVTLTTFGPTVPQHSGHYGNFIPNPVFHLARILGSVKSPEGRVLLPGFYDGIVIDDELKSYLDAVPDDEAAILRHAGVAEADQVAPSLQEALQYPSLNIRGISAAWVGDEARTIIPATATAEIDIRLVKESDPAHLIGLLRAHIEELDFYVTDREPTGDERRQHYPIVSFTSSVSYAAFRSDFDAPPGLLARAGMRHLYGEEPVLIRTMGGSIPISPFVDTLDIPAAIVPTVNIDNNQHSPNENIRLGNFIEGISILASVLSQEID
jgi:acetylornithine deacetylase/succinyl-diaminopimelate desuccinylase-like protein